MHAVGTGIFDTFTDDGTAMEVGAGADDNGAYLIHRPVRSTTWLI